MVPWHFTITSVSVCLCAEFLCEHLLPAFCVAVIPDFLNYGRTGCRIHVPHGLRRCYFGNETNTAPEKEIAMTRELHRAEINQWWQFYCQNLCPSTTEGWVKFDRPQAWKKRKKHCSHLGDVMCIKIMSLCTVQQVLFPVQHFNCNSGQWSHTGGSRFSEMSCFQRQRHTETTMSKQAFIFQKTVHEKRPQSMKTLMNEWVIYSGCYIHFCRIYIFVVMLILI